MCTKPTFIKQRGFTLFELLATLIVISIMTVAFSPVYLYVNSVMESLYNESNSLDDRLIVNSLLGFAQQNTTAGVLPNAYTGGNYTSTVFNPADTSAAGVLLTNALTSSGITPSTINDDGYTDPSVRVYQKISGLTQIVPFFLSSGPVVTLTYDVGAVYMTSCRLSETSTCNPTSATGIPGDSVAMTSSNYTTWDTSGSDKTPVLISTLPLQKQKLKSTGARLLKTIQSIQSFYRASQLAAAASATTNFYPLPNGTGAPDLSGQDPTTNEGCHDGWYDLSAALVNVLNRVGLTQSTHGTTAWSGVIAYCPDYEPTAADGTTAGDPPHYGALRINQALSSGVAPTNATTNIILPL